MNQQSDPRAEGARRDPRRARFTVLQTAVAGCGAGLVILILMIVITLLGHR
jgi:hypothetical protein